MTPYEYKVLPAPRKGTKAKGVKAPEDRFALSLQEVMNREAAQGWEFQRAETLPSDERSGLKSARTVYRDMLVFRRAIAAPDVRPEPAPETAPQPAVNPAPVEQPTFEAPAPANPAPAAPTPANPAAPSPIPAREDPPLGARPAGDDAERPGERPQVIFRAPPRDEG